MSNNPWDNLKPEPSKESGKVNREVNKDFDLLSFFEGLFGYNAKNIQKFNFSKFFVVVAVLYLSTGIFTIAPEQQAIITRFGKYNRTVNPGLHYRLPFPFESIHKETVTRVRTMKIGSDVNDSVRDSSSSKMSYLVSDNSKNTRLQDGLVLTGDENIIDMHFEVQWKIKDLKQYVFRVKDPVKTISDVSQSVIREVVAQNTLSDIITKGRSIIESSTLENVQVILDEYNSGVEIINIQMLRADPPLPVIDAFRDVQTARVDKESEVNRAESYRNDIIPKARGAAQKILQDAEAYAIETTSKAHGQSSRFNNVYEQYKNSKYVTRKRIYLETMEDIFSNMDKILIDENAAKGVNSYLPLDLLVNNKNKTQDAQE